jgi:hypothetical protein
MGVAYLNRVEKRVGQGWTFWCGRHTSEGKEREKTDGTTRI